MGLRPGQRVLEIGPGPGRVLIPAARQVLPGGEVVGLEIQPGMLDRLKARAAQSGVTNLTAVLGDATQPHFPPESFDVVYLCTALAEIRDREEALRQCWQALKPGGRLSITEVMVDPALPIACDRAAAGRSRRVPAGARVQPGVSLHGQFRQGVEALLAAPWQAKL
jgi:ubiquinone/menaquinone biosynthesis C-methylase UbiE